MSLGVIRKSALSPSLSFPPPLPPLSLSLCPKLYSKSVHNTSLTETRRSDDNPEVRELIAMEWPLYWHLQQFACSHSRYF